MKSAPQDSAPVLTATTLVLDRPDLDRSVYNEPGFRLQLLRWLVSVAAADGQINLAEYREIRALAAENDSALEVVTTLRLIEEPIPVDSALTALREVAAQLDSKTRRLVLERALPLLRLQGDQALFHANLLAAALNLKLTQDQRKACEDVATPASLQTALTSPLRTLQGRSIRSAAVDTFRMTGDSQLTFAIDRYVAGGATVDEVKRIVVGALKDVEGMSREFEDSLARIPASRQDLEGGVASAERFFQQIGQRLAIVEARINADKQQFNEEFDEFIHDAGNAIELEILDRLKTDDWTLSKVWQSIGRSTFAKELERRIERIARRHERQLQLMKEDLRLFQQEYRLAQAQVIERTHFSQLGSLMPGLSTTTRVLNATEGFAEVTLGVGAVASLGTGAAIYALGTAVVLPIIAPIVPIAGGAVLVAGAIKWMMDKEGRKDEEVRDKRRAFESAIRERLSEMRSAYFEQLDSTGREFLATAHALARPVLLEAHARREVASLEHRVGQAVLHRNQETVKSLLGQLG